MKKLIIGALFAVASLAATAQIDTSKLTAAQYDELVKHAKAMEAKTPVSISEATRLELTEWGKMGQGLSAALVAAAKDLGIATNEFAQTPIGKVTTVIVVYKMIGEDIINLLFAMLVGIIGYGASMYLLFNAKDRVYEYVDTPVFWGMYIRKAKRIVSSKVGSDGNSIAITGMVVMVCTTVLVGVML